MKILILSANTGEGHNSAAKALKHYFEISGNECDITDSLSYVSRFVSKIVAGGHVFLYRYMPWLFHLVYNGAEKLAKKEESSSSSFIYWVLSFGKKRLYNAIKAGGYERVVCVHPFAAQMLTSTLKSFPALNVKTYFVATDYTSSPGVGESKLDAYVIAHEDVAHDFITKGVPEEKISCLGIPISPRYSSLPKKEEARDALGIPRGNSVILLMCGSMGCGPVKKITPKLVDKLTENTTLVVVCGRNKRLYSGLYKKFGKMENVRILAFTSDMPTYMAASDIYVTKPGGLSSTESACAGLPMLIVDAVADARRTTSISF